MIIHGVALLDDELLNHRPVVCLGLRFWFSTHRVVVCVLVLNSLYYFVDLFVQRFLYSDSAHFGKESKMLVSVDWIVFHYF